MLDLKHLLEQSIKSRIEKETTSQKGCLSGSNAVLWDGYNFEAEGSDHCPRIALLRRVADLQEEKLVKSYLSNNHGRLFEDLLRVLIDECKELESREEEEVEVIIADKEGKNILTARPDKVLKYQDKLYPVEVKTVQSGTTAYQIFIKEKPKLGAVIQLAIYMIGHQLDTGILLYAASCWYSGFYGKTRWSVEPGFKTFQVTKQGKEFLYDDKTSVVTVEKIISGAYQIKRHEQNNTLPSIPLWVDVNGDSAPYSGCKYCAFAVICESYTDNSLSEFFNLASEVLKDKQ